MVTKKSKRPKIIIKNGRKYVLIGKKKIRVSKSITERELIKFIIKHLHTKRKPRKDIGETRKSTAKPGLNESFAYNSINRFKQQLEDKQKELDDKQKELNDKNKSLILPPSSRPVSSPTTEPTTDYKSKNLNIFNDSDQFRLMQQYYNRYKKDYPRDRDNNILPKVVKSLPSPKKDNNLLHYSPAHSKDKQMVVVEDVDDDEVEQAINPQKAKNHDVDELNRIRTTYNSKKFLNQKERNALSIFANKYGISNRTSPPNTKNPRGISNIINDVLDLIALKSRDNVIDTGQTSKNEVADDDDKIIGDLLGDGKGTYNEPLSNIQIDNMMNKYPEYLGCIASDQIISKILPQIKPKGRYCFVMNLDKSTGVGTHWVSVFIDARPNGSHSIEYYNSFGEEPTKSFLKDIKKVASKLESDTYLKLKINKLCQQNNTSANCGFFAIRFLLNRLNNQHWTDATDWNSRIKEASYRGEKEIEKFKKMHGYGIYKFIGSFANKVKDVIKDGITRVTTAVTGVRTDYPPNVKRWLKDHGDEKILSITVIREPINSMISKAINWISLGEFDKHKQELGFDKLFHLFAVIKFEKGEEARIEKNHVIEMYKNNGKSYSNSEKISVNSNGKTLTDLLENAYKKGGPSLFKYNSGNANCQNFLTTLLSSSGLLTSTASSFINQNVKTLIDKLHPIVRKTIDTVTDIADRGDSLLNGGKAIKRVKKRHN